MTEQRALGPDDDDLLRAFYDGPYLAAFAAQREPREAWAAALRGDAPYQLTVRVAGAHLRDPARRAVHGGIVFERYPQSGCGLLTYLVVAPAWRGAGLGRALLDGAIAALAGCTHVLGEVVDPARGGDAAWARLDRFQRWGARVIDAGYVQPRLGDGLARDRDLRLLAFPAGAPLPDTIDGDAIAAFVAELYAATEGAPPRDPEGAAMLAGLRGPLRLISLAR